MERNLAILMADLSGYTALTEAHGASSAADLIDRYIEIVKVCLVGDSEIHERTGDEVMIVSGKADFLLSTAILILEKTHKEDNFLQLHGGLHFGKLLKRKNSYFGTPINLTSRIASSAAPGSFLCSSEFVNALEEKDQFSLLSKGKQNFKNLSEENELFEIIIENRKSFYVDPICRMLILNTEKAIPHPELPGIFFCSQGCLKKHSQALTANSY